MPAKGAEEDLRLDGSRLKPPGAVDIDKSNQLASLPPNRSAPEFEAAVDRPAKGHKKGESEHWNHETIVAVDWNDGASAPDAWPNQNAVPWVAPVIGLSLVFYELHRSCHFIVRRIRAGYLYSVHRRSNFQPGSTQQIQFFAGFSLAIPPNCRI